MRLKMAEKTILHEIIQEHYAAAAQGTCDCGECCSDASASVRWVDYPQQGVEVLKEADLGLGCGIPTLFAEIKPGETVLDLGSGAGIDVFLAANKVGSDGFVIGVDMTPEMISKAQGIAAKAGVKNVDFRLGYLENLPVDDDSVDLALSNCVINLVPDKQRVFAELFRVLRPGGRFVISDTVTYGPVPEETRKDMALWAGCIAGASDQDEYLEIIREAGFSEVTIFAAPEFDYLRGENYGLASLTVGASKPWS
jgi:arsenite methyltransferase